jgi:hypothetical protein
VMHLTVDLDPERQRIGPYPGRARHQDVVERAPTTPAAPAALLVGPLAAVRIGLAARSRGPSPRRAAEFPPAGAIAAAQDRFLGLSRLLVSLH